MIYAIWYPSGGFGHFINAFVSYHGHDFCRPLEQFHTSSNGNSHGVPLVLPKYSKREQTNFVLPKIDPAVNYSLLIDNGINDESIDFIDQLPDCKVIKICYDDLSWPIIAKTHVVKAMSKNFDGHIAVDSDKWQEPLKWAKREKFFLYLRDHDLRHCWRPDTRFHTLNISDLYTYQKLEKTLAQLGISIEQAEPTWMQWHKANFDYLSPVFQAKDVIDHVKKSQNFDLTEITDVWAQAVIYYYLWLEFSREVPHNSFRNFFVDTHQIRDWLSL